MNMNTENAKTTSFDRYHDRHGCDRTSRDRRYHLESISRMDVQDRSGCEFRNFDPTMRFDSHDVDANGDRCCVLVQRQHHNGNPQIATAMASGNRAEGNGQRPRNPRRSIQFFGRNEVSHRKGQALVEFAFVSIVMVMLVTGLMAILVMALGSFQNNIATESAGRLLDGHPLFIKENFVTHFTMDPDDPDPFYGDDDFENVTARQVYRFLNEYPDPFDGRVLYDERWLILSEDEWDHRKDLPLPAINRSLLGQYIFDPDLDFDGQEEQGGFRFPGAVVTNPTGNRTVMIPLLPGTNASGIERTFHITPTALDFYYPVSQNWVAPVVIGKEQGGNGFEFRVIMFHPSQPAALQYVDNQLVEADDSAVAIGAPPTGYALLQDPQPINPKFDGSSTSRGEFGLGELGIGGGTLGRDGLTPAIPPRKIRPFRMVFETSSLFRMGAYLNPLLVKYEAEGTAIALDKNAIVNGDQFLNFERRVIDRSDPTQRRYIINDMASSDFDTNLIQLQANDGGNWRVVASAEIQRTGGADWDPGHEIELRLYRNGLYDRLIDRRVVDTAAMAAPDQPIVLKGDATTQALANDFLQVRIFTRYPNMAYDVELTGATQTNWVSFERVRD